MEQETKSSVEEWVEAVREWVRLADQSNSVFLYVQAQVQILQQLDSKYLDNQVNATPICWQPFSPVTS